MSLHQFPTVDCPSSQPQSQQQQQQCYSGPASDDHCALSKGKLDDYVSTLDDDDNAVFSSELVSSAVRMCKDDSLSAISADVRPSSDGEVQSYSVSSDYVQNSCGADAKSVPSWSMYASSSSSSAAFSSSSLPKALDVEAPILYPDDFGGAKFCNQRQSRRHRGIDPPADSGGYQNSDDGAEADL